MPSQVSGLEYDIFISYRHNDNRSGWVRKFVENLKIELAATIKEPLTIYFDENPHDGLLETDIVYDSLRDKLKCVIFIPILSQTYCDPKSFAWNHEFLVFKHIANEDGVGLKVKQANGNITSRLLPVKIHDLDVKDQNLLETELGPLRTIDFIFRSPGVNRPLTLNDKRTENLNKISYRDQVNKVANCIKEIITSLTGKNEAPVGPPIGLQSAKKNAVKRRLAWIIGIVLIALITSALYFFPRSGSEPLERSIAVLPFEDLSEGHDQEYFSDGVSEEILNALVKIEGLKVAGRTSSFQFRGKSMDLKEIGEQLGVGLILEGSVRKAGNHVRITTQLVNAGNGYQLWSKSYDHELKDIFVAQDEVTRGIVFELQQRLGINGLLPAKKQPTENLEAYDLYWKGHQQMLLKGQHVIKARELLIEAIRLDPDFAMAHAGLAEAYAVFDFGLGNRDEAIRSAKRALALDSTMSSAYAVLAWSIARNANGDGNIEKYVEDADIIHAYFERAIMLDPQNSTARLWFGITKLAYGLFEPAIEQLRAAMEIDPLVPINQGVLGYVEYLSGQDSIGFVHLNESIKMGWKAGNQRLAFYYLDRQEWEKAEFCFNEAAKIVKSGPQLDYHQLVTAIREKDVLIARKICASIVNARGIGAGFIPRVAYLSGDKDGMISSLRFNEGVTEALRPDRSEIRKMPGFRDFVNEIGLIAYWNKHGWPDACTPVGEHDFRCD
jgi:TolB-like protein